VSLAGDLSERLLPASLTTSQACRELGVSAAWLARHRSLFDWFPIPGRGRCGQEYRYTARSIEEYKQRSRKILVLSGDEPPPGLKTRELAQWFAARRERDGSHECL
jgi:hypothetical protein